MPTVNPADVSMVGDSVMLGALSALQEALPGCIVDAKVSRQLWDAYAVLDALEGSGTLGSTVVVALGTNGPFSVEDGQGIVDRLGPDRQIYWVTAYGTYLSWQEQSNSSIRAIAAQNPNVTVIDWAAAAAQNPGWLYSDGIHLQGDGQAAYAALIRDSIGYTPPPPTESDDAPLVIWDAEQGIRCSQTRKYQKRPAYQVANPPRSHRTVGKRFIRSPPLEADVLKNRCMEHAAGFCV